MRKQSVACGIILVVTEASGRGFPIQTASVPHPRHPKFRSPPEAFSLPLGAEQSNETRLRTTYVVTPSTLFLSWFVLIGLGRVMYIYGCSYEVLICRLSKSDAKT